MTLGNAARQDGVADGGDLPRVLIVSESTSAAFGGEAVLPLHYFRGLKRLEVPVWLITHARTRDELSKLFPDDRHIHYVEDSVLDRVTWRIGQFMPARLANFTLGFLSRLFTQLAQRRLARRLIRSERIDVVHQPTPVSPREPSVLYNLGAPVVIGPLNGGMSFPPAFAGRSGSVETSFMRVGRAVASLLNRLIPGKRYAALLLVANRRTRDALPKSVTAPVEELVENGVDFAVWHAAIDPLVGQATEGSPAELTEAGMRFAYLGRLVDWKCVDLLLEAVALASRVRPLRLDIIGDGPERASLEKLAGSLGLLNANGKALVTFVGWMSQPACAARLRQADALVLPSLYECGGAVVLEAMSLAKPVIATNWGGPADYLDPSCGILVAPAGRQEFISALRDAMLKLSDAPEESRQMGKRGLAKVRAEYDWDLKVQQILKHYCAVRDRSAQHAPASLH